MRYWLSRILVVILVAVSGCAYDQSYEDALLPDSCTLSVGKSREDYTEYGKGRGVWVSFDVAWNLE